MRFVNLHTHSTYSYGDGHRTPAIWAKRIAELSGTSMALTEHGLCNLSSHVQWEKAAKECNIKPLYGLEAYIAPRGERRKWHQTIIAMNEIGYRNLCELVRRSWAEGFYQFPTISSQLLAEHSEGLIVLSGCADSLLACTLFGGKSNGPKRNELDAGAGRDATIDAASRVIKWYKALFGGRYYIEVQRFPGLDRTCLLNPVLAELAARHNIPLVATADAHYPYPNENQMQKVLHSAQRGGTVAKSEASWEYDILLTPPESDAEIGKDLMATGLTRNDAWSAIMNTDNVGGIAARCDVKLPKAKQLSYPISDDDWSDWE